MNIPTCPTDGQSPPVPRELRCQSISTRRGALEVLYLPPASMRKHTLLALHGISRDAETVFSAFYAAAQAKGIGLITPKFTAKRWPVFQRFTRRHRADLALLDILGALGLRKVRVYGHSGGAQLAHRFAMLYPNWVERLHLGAAGWYTHPDPTVSYPLGTGKGGAIGRAMRKMAPLFHQVPVTVHCGTKDIRRDASLRTAPELDQMQGRDRFRRANHYVETLHAQNQAARLHQIPDAGHRFEQCVADGTLIQAVLAD